MDEELEIGTQIPPTIAECLALIPRRTSLADFDSVVRVFDGLIYFKDDSKAIPGRLGCPIISFIDEHKRIIAWLEELNDASYRCVTLADSETT